MAPYPTKDEITEIFRNMEKGNVAGFFERVSPDVDWTVMGTHPLAQHYTSLQDVHQGTLARLNAVFKPPGAKLMVRNVIGGGEDEWATVELTTKGECLNGLEFNNLCAYCVRFDKSGQIVQLRSYVDIHMVVTALEQNGGSTS